MINISEKAKSELFEQLNSQKADGALPLESITPPPSPNPLSKNQTTKNNPGGCLSRSVGFSFSGLPTLKEDRTPVPSGVKRTDTTGTLQEDGSDSFKTFPAYKKIRLEQKVAKELGIFNPFFLCHEGAGKSTTKIDGKEYINFASYDYLDLNGNSKINEAVYRSIQKYGTSATASRLVAGERPIHRELEKELAGLYQAEDCVVYVSGHATNVSTITDLFGAEDVIFHDSLSHNSIVLGANYSRAKRVIYPHNDMAELEKLLELHRSNYKRALIVTEGVFSMDGDIADLPTLAELKKKFHSFLMVDEAHALGVLGKNGKGTWEHFGIDPSLVDIWMGTLSKTLCGCGGFICGTKELIELLKFTSPSFVFSVGLSPALAAASLEALHLMEQETWRIQKLQELSKEFLSYSKRADLETGKAAGTAIVPIMVGSSLLAGKLAAFLFDRGINVLPIVHPVVEEGSARLRFFLTASHTKEQIRHAVDLVRQLLPIAMDDIESMREESEQ